LKHETQIKKLHCKSSILFCCTVRHSTYKVHQSASSQDFNVTEVGYVIQTSLL